MTIENERLIEYLGLEFELCYLKPAGDAVWILADKIRRKDDIAMEMLRLFHRFTRIGKSLDRMNEPRPSEPLSLPGRDDGATVIASPGAAGNNTPYAACIGVRVRVKEHVAAFHVRPGIDVATVANAPRISSGALLDPRFQLSVDDPIVQILSKPMAAPPSTHQALANEPSMQRPKRLRSSKP